MISHCGFVGGRRSARPAALLTAAAIAAIAAAAATVIDLVEIGRCDATYRTEVAGCAMHRRAISALR
jgi:hypothetical protein